MYKNIVFWLEYPLFHVSSLIESISRNVNVIVVCEHEIPQWRLDMGFIIPDFGNAQVYLSPPDKVRAIIIESYSNIDTVHVFHGLRGVKNNYKCFKEVINRNCIVGLYFEPSQFRGSIKSFLRWLIYKFLVFKIKNNIAFVLALGELGREQYVSLGFESSKVYNFPYFIDENYIASYDILVDRVSTIKEIKILFVGQLIPTKNVEMLIDSIALLISEGYQLKLYIIGDGELKGALIERVKVLKIDSSVVFLGYHSNSKLKNFFLNSDVFVLPSKFDGWGVVAVEAMAHGLPVIISNRCGAFSIIKEDSHGMVFKSSETSSLVEGLKYILENIDFYCRYDNKKIRVDYIKRNFSSSVASSVFFNILEEL